MEPLSPALLRALLHEGHRPFLSALRFRGAWRVGVFAQSGEGLAVPPLADGFAAELPSGLRPGGWNAGYATPFTHAWWSAAGVWTCVGADGRPLARYEGGVLRTAAGELSSIAGIRLVVDPGWEIRRLVAVGAGGELEVAREEDAAPTVDPSYDWDMLSADLAWLEQMGRSLAEGVGVGVEEEIGGR